MAQVIQMKKVAPQSQATVYRFELNGRDYEVSPTIHDQWRWRSGKWWDWDFRTKGGFPNYAAAAQDAMRDARERNKGGKAR